LPALLEFPDGRKTTFSVKNSESDLEKGKGEIKALVGDRSHGEIIGKVIDRLRRH